MNDSALESGTWRVVLWSLAGWWRSGGDKVDRRAGVASSSDRELYNILLLIGFTPLTRVCRPDCLVSIEVLIMIV